MDIVATILWPIIVAMEFVLDGFHAVSGSYGIAIILLSAVVRVVTSPISRIGRRQAQRERLVQARMQPELAEARAQYTGRERFERIETIYAEHSYHPIQSMASLLPLVVQVPFLLAALLLLVDHPELVGARFLFISDLSKPDALLQLSFVGTAINILPLLLTAVALLESFIDPNATRSSRNRFMIVAIVLLVLIYTLPAAVCLYWLASNVWSLFAAVLAPGTPAAS
ncbi:membrane protein insertase YidC [uncultured Nitratireductor sp.]|uniref:YidC/Oxa1 family membrane protein insertase n=1 Tax=uncultured Nitratireductor sp. TaxID=520953 RepID=UPI0025FBE9EB|nr:membrane protein insertase YidC [uncultured Nitratireductor sp.]